MAMVERVLALAIPECQSSEDDGTPVILQWPL